MSRTLIAAAVIVAAATFTTAAVAADGETPFPSPKVLQVFVAAQTVTVDRAVITQVAPGGTVVFRAYAVDPKTKKVLAAKDVKYFYVTIAAQPNVKLKFDPQAPGATARMPWTGTWTVPADYAAGTVNFKVLIKIQAKRKGQFVQLPVASAQLTVTKTTTTSLTSPVAVGPAAAAAPRPVGCTQTNVFKRGEQFVLRTWGSDMATGDILSAENVDTATFTVPGVTAPVTLNWGAHGATTNRVWFWSNAWNIPSDYPLGDAVIRVTFKLDSGKVGTFDYSITIIP